MLQIINRQTGIIRRATGLKNLAVLAICVVLVSSYGLSAAGFTGSTTDPGAAAPHRDGNGADAVSAVTDQRGRDRDASMRVCGRGPQARLVQVAMTFIDGFNERDFSAWRDVLADDFTAIYVPTGPAVLDQEAAEAVNQSFLAAFDDLIFAVDRVLVSASCDSVAIYWTATGTFTGPLVTPSGAVIDPTSQSGVVPGVYTAEIEDGQILREWTHWDQLTMFVQLGVLPPL